MSTAALARSDVTATARTRSSRATHPVTARRRRVVEVGGNVLLAAAVVLCIPVVILAVGIPIALLVQLLLWIARLI